MMQSLENSVMDRQTDGRTDGQTDGETDRQTNRQTDKNDFIGHCPTDVKRPISFYFYREYKKHISDNSPRPLSIVLHVPEAKNKNIDLYII